MSQPAQTHHQSWLQRYPLLGPIFSLLFVVLLFEVLIYSHNQHSFLAPQVINNVLTQTVCVAVGTLGMTLVIVSGGIDLSAGSVVALASVVAGLLLKNGHSSWLAAFAAILVGATVGLINGSVIARFAMMPFIVTLGMMSTARGLAKLVSDNQSVNYNFGTSEGINFLMNNPDTIPPGSVPHWLFSLFSTFMPADPDVAGNLVVPLWMPPIGVVLLLVLAVIMSLVLNRSVFGRHIFALGSNEDTARLCGLRTRLLKVGVYVLSGVFIGLSGVFDLTRLHQGDPTIAVGRELDIIAAVVIGGASLSGGVGSIWGAIIGALTMTALRSGTVQMGWASYWQEIIIGIVIVLAVGVDKIRSRSLKG